MTVIAVVAVMSAIFTNKKAKFKNTQLGDIIHEIFPNCVYEPDNFILPEEYKATEMLRMGSNYEGSDLLSGQTSTGVPFRYCEIYTYDVTHDSKGSSSKTTVFKGGLFTFDYPKHFEYKIVAAPKGITKGQGFGKAWFEGYKKVETESVEFNKAFTVYSNNMEEVFYIFTPQVMERFIQLNNKYKKGIIFGLKDGKINIAVPGLNMFEPPAFGLKNPAKLEEFKNKTREQLDMFLTIEQLLRLEPQSDEAYQQWQAEQQQQQTHMMAQIANDPNYAAMQSNPLFNDGSSQVQSTGLISSNQNQSADVPQQQSLSQSTSRFNINNSGQ